ncbi:phospholipid-transporting ATPase, putative [Entamoeba invadens IP1]|uniref:phospholipid-transporting ATPase, putative n=1 Tax=Entamoeba invadens IP1 TaxID=370355 RepID=UPI0002C3E490|nr:phospholipid-transporting ATPase, putative [Entamoeba invadens IP1]ELP93552.1 phospholipid-transporting ATPase, putative [Entamoeba invadens IP1]|eukprot:XP_004260323.1 phospholipid-transporting ATPase, putative [Entamoeba invadens IP1]
MGWLSTLFFHVFPCLKPKDVRKTPLPPIYLYDEKKNKKFPGNKVSTTKYSIFSFIFVFLYNQFKHVTNIYFLLVAIISLIPQISATNPVTNVFPLIFVLCISAIKEIIEDIRRWLADRGFNNQKYTAINLNDGSTLETTSAKVRTGTLVELHTNDRIPADCIPLSSTNEDGVVFVQTAALDGETNLKEVFVPKEIVGKDPIQLRGTLYCNPPSEYFNEYNATFHLDLDGQNKDVPVGSNNLLIGGSVVKDTEKAIALVVHCGIHTKLALNQPKLRTKFAHTDSRMNQFVFGIFVFKIIIVAIAAGLSGWYVNYVGRDSWYLDLKTVNIGTYVVKTFFRYFGLMSYLIPISCAVSLEVAKFIQTMFMESDTDFHVYTLDDEGKIVVNTMQAKTSILNDELSLVEYVLSDKTGTLTENMMRFKKASVDGELIDGKDLMTKYKAHYTVENPKMFEDLIQNILNGHVETDTKIAMRENVDVKHATQIEDYLLALALCNEARPKIEGDKMMYQSQSPDEIALCDHALECGVVFFKRTQTTMTVSLFGKILEYKILDVFSFNSDRKRQSVVLETPSGEIVLYTKGADSIIAARMDKEDNFVPTTDHLNSCSEVGLRTLLVTKKVLEKEKYDEWKARYVTAENTLENREEKVSVLQDELETNLKLVGMTAIEDKLQDGVPETIEFLIRGGIKVWMITGDKVETAINIGLSCNLVTQDTELFKIRNAGDEVENKEEFILNRLEEVYKEINEKKEAWKIENTTKKIGCVFEAGALHIMMEHALPLFSKVAISSDVVICSRVTPKQKAMIAQTVKRATKKVVLTIGDGANDVAMINEGDIGVGLFGKEGTQAARASDYALRKFRHVAKLIMFHGRQSLLRNVTLIKMCFYKNSSFFLILFWYSFFSGYSGMSMYDDYTMTFFNIFITSLPPIFVACTDRDLPYQVIKDNPEVHRRILLGSRMSIWSFLDWLQQGIWQSLVIVFEYHFIIGQTDIFAKNGIPGGWAVVSMYITFSGFFMVFFTLMTQVKTWNWWTVFSFVISFLLFILFVLLIAYFPGLSNRDLSRFVFSAVLAQPYFYFLTFFSSVVGVAPNIIRLMCMRYFAPNYYMILQEIYNKKRFEGYGKDRKIVIEGTEEAHEYYSELSKSRPLFNKLPQVPKELAVIDEQHDN